MRFARISVLVSILHASGSWLVAQAGSGTILGTVTDTSGAVVPNATVSITNVGTNVATTARTTSSGDFTVIFLPPGTYRIVAEAQGFQQAVADRVNLPSEAVPLLERAAKLRPDDEVVWYRLSRAQRAKGDNAAAAKSMAIFRSIRDSDQAELRSPNPKNEITPQRLDTDAEIHSTKPQ